MATGAAQMDGAIIVVSAVDGPLAQTREHLILARQNGVQSFVLFINHVDKEKDPEVLDMVEMEMKELLSQYGYDGDNTPVVMGSALCALEGREPEIGQEAIEKLLDHVDEYIQIPDRNSEQPFLLPVENVFSISGRGTVVTGRVERGTLQKGEEIEIVGDSDEAITARVESIETFKKELDAAMAGDNVGILLRDVTRDDVKHGMVLAMPDSVILSSKFEAELYFQSEHEGGRTKPSYDNFEAQFFFRTTTVTGAIKFPEGKDIVVPGDCIPAVIEVFRKIPLEEGEKFIIREGAKTVVTGVVSRIIE